MTTTARFLLASLAMLVLGIAALGGIRDSHAAEAYKVSLAPTAQAVAPGSDGVFTVRIETQAQDTNLPRLDFAATGGEITGVVAINALGGGAGEGAVYVRRDTPGPVHLTASVGGAVVAQSDMQFSQMGAISITVTLDAGPDAASRTWLFEVTDTAGTLVQRLSIGTSGDAPTATAYTRLLPYGSYNVRQMLGNDTSLSCGNGAFYQVAAPASGSTTLELAASQATANFTINVCAGTPELSMDIPIDTIAQAAPGVVGDAVPGETPINEVRGARQEGPGTGAVSAFTPAPPNTGTGVRHAETDGASPFAMLAVLLGLAFLSVPPLAITAKRVGARSRR